MGSLLTRLPLPGRGATETGRSAPLWWAGAAAAGVSLLGLVGLSAAVLVIETLDPGSGLSFGGSLALAGRLWLLANGGQLDLSSGPLVLAPLLLTGGIGWGLSRTTRAAVAAGGAGSPRVALQVMTAVLVHVALTLLLAVALDSRTTGVGLPRTMLGAAVVAFASAGWGAARESGGLDVALDRLPGPARPVLRGAVAGGLTALGLCTAIVAMSVAADARGYAALSASLGGAGAAALGLLALGLLLLPNAAAAVVGMAAGPGFVVGSGTVVSVHGVTLGAVPAFPLFAALPDTQAVPLVVLASQAVPAVAGLVAGVTVGRWLSADDGGSVVAGLCGVVAGVLLGLGGAVLTSAAGGSLGDGALATVGAPPLATGVALGAQCGIAAALAAAVTRWRTPG